MRISIHQPDYLPWLGYFNKIKNSDVFVFLDSASYSRNGFHNRNKIKTSQGWCYLTIPISRDQIFKPIKNVVLPEDSSWANKHWQSIKTSYAKAPFWNEYKDFLDDYFNVKINDFKTLADLNIYFIEKICHYLGLKVKLFRDSQLSINHELKSSELLLEVCKNLEAKSYLSGPSGKKYLDSKIFEENNIGIDFQNYQAPEYDQLFDGFIPGLSILDLLFNHGPESINYL